MKVNKSYADLLELVRWLNSTPVERGGNSEIKLKKIVEKVKPIFDQYNEKREAIRLEHAHADVNGVLFLNEKGDYSFTKQGIKDMAIAMKNLLSETFEFDEFTFSTEGIESFKFLLGWVEGIEPDKPQADEQV